MINSSVDTKSTALTLALMCAISLPVAPVLTGVAMAADQERVPDAPTVIGPLRRGANGEIEAIKPTTNGRTTIACPSASSAAVRTGKALETLAPGHWMNVANSHLESVAYRGPLADQIEGAEGPSAVMNDWSGGTLDTQDNRLIVWGGGHGGYFGNEIYAFDLKTLAWSRLTDPSSVSGWSRTSPILPDGSPSVQHTYDALVYLPKTHQMFVAGSEAATPNGNSYPLSWIYNFGSKSWRPSADFVGTSYGTIAAFNPTDGLVYAVGQGTGLQSYNPATNNWTRIGRQPLPDYHMTGALDPIDNLLVATGNGFLAAINLTTSILTSVSSSGDQRVQKGNAPGFVWYPPAKLFVGWNGGSTLYTLDPRTWQWTAYTAAADNTVTPTAANGNGTFGRFQYAAADNVFVVVNDTKQDVFVYKPCF